MFSKINSCHFKPPGFLSKIGNKAHWCWFGWLFCTSSVQFLRQIKSEDKLHYKEYSRFSIGLSIRQKVLSFNLFLRLPLFSLNTNTPQVHCMHFLNFIAKVYWKDLLDALQYYFHSSLILIYLKFLLKTTFLFKKMFQKFKLKYYLFFYYKLK